MKKACIALAIIAVMFIMPTAVYAGNQTDCKISENGTYDIGGYGNDSIITINAGLTVTLTNAGNSVYTNMQIACGEGVSLTLSGVKIDNSSYDYACPLLFSGSGNALILEGDSSLLAGSNKPCVYVGSGTSLEISGVGTVNITGGSCCAGLGSNKYDRGGGGTITIKGGTVIAQGGWGSAGIGGGYGSYGGTITIESGTVAANGGGSGAGIGGGYGCGGTINISGGEVTATGGWGSAGLGGGYWGDGGMITIKGGTVFATGGESGAGIGGGFEYGGGAITIAGGVIYAQKGERAPVDIGYGESGSGGTLAITGGAAVFLRNDTCITPTTTAYTHETITSAADNIVYGLPTNGWTPPFGVYIAPYMLSYDANGGTGTFSVTQHINTAATVSDGNGLSRLHYTFSGWNTAADGSGEQYEPGGTIMLGADTTLYAQWTAVITGLPASLEMNTGGSVTWEPEPDGGAWDWDETFFSSDSHSGAAFTTLREGTSTITYTVGGASQSVTVTARQDPAVIWLLIGAGLFVTAAAAVTITLYRRKKTGALHN